MRLIQLWVKIDYRPQSRYNFHYTNSPLNKLKDSYHNVLIKWKLVAFVNIFAIINIV